MFRICTSYSFNKIIAVASPTGVHAFPGHIHLFILTAPTWVPSCGTGLKSNGKIVGFTYDSWATVARVSTVRPAYWFCS